MDSWVVKIVSRVLIVIYFNLIFKWIDLFTMYIQLVKSMLKNLDKFIVIEK